MLAEQEVERLAELAHERYRQWISPDSVAAGVPMPSSMSRPVLPTATRCAS